MNDFLSFASERIAIHHVVIGAAQIGAPDVKPWDFFRLLDYVVLLNTADYNASVILIFYHIEVPLKFLCGYNIPRKFPILKFVPPSPPPQLTSVHVLD